MQLDADDLPLRQAPHPGIAAVLSVLVPGLGQVYCGRLVAGGLWFVATSSRLVDDPRARLPRARRLRRGRLPRLRRSGRALRRRAGGLAVHAETVNSAEHRLPLPAPRGSAPRDALRRPPRETRERLRQATHQAFERCGRLRDRAAPGTRCSRPAISSTRPILSTRTELFLARAARALDAGRHLVPGRLRQSRPGRRRASPSAALGVERRARALLPQPGAQALRVTDAEGARRRRGGRRRLRAASTESANLAARIPARRWLAARDRAAAHERREREGRRRARALRAVDRAPITSGSSTPTGRLATSTCASRRCAGLPVHYAGNLQGRHIGGTGEKGGLVGRGVRGSQRRAARSCASRACAGSTSSRASCPRSHRSARSRTSSRAGSTRCRAPATRRRRCAWSSPESHRSRAACAPTTSSRSSRRRSPPERASSRSGCEPRASRCRSIEPGCEPTSVLAEALALIERAGCRRRAARRARPAELAHAPEGDRGAPRLPAGAARRSTRRGDSAWCRAGGA